MGLYFKLFYDLQGPRISGSKSTVPVVRRPGNAPEIPLLAGAPPVVTAGLNAFGAWVGIATPANNFVVSHWISHMLTIPAGLVRMTVELGIGGGPTGVDAQMFNSPITDPMADATGFENGLAPTMPQIIPAGSLVSARAFCSDGGIARTFEVLVAGWDTSIPVWTIFNPPTLTGPGSWLPSNTTFTSLAGAVAPAFGAWSQYIASAAADLLITHINVQNTLSETGTPYTAVQVGIGAAGSEIAISTTMFAHGDQTVAINPPIKVLAGERVAARQSSSNATAKLTAIKQFPI